MGVWLGGWVGLGGSVGRLHGVGALSTIPRDHLRVNNLVVAYMYFVYICILYIPIMYFVHMYFYISTERRSLYDYAGLSRAFAAENHF